MNNQKLGETYGQQYWKYDQITIAIPLDWTGSKIHFKVPFSTGISFQTWLRRGSQQKCAAVRNYQCSGEAEAKKCILNNHVFPTNSIPTHVVWTYRRGMQTRSTKKGCLLLPENSVDAHVICKFDTIFKHLECPRPFRFEA
eukprot:4794205-Amphidinium_carterae.1